MCACVSVVCMCVRLERVCACVCVSVNACVVVWWAGLEKGPRGFLIGVRRPRAGAGLLDPTFL